MFRLGTSKINQKKHLHGIFITLVYYLVFIELSDKRNGLVKFGRNPRNLSIFFFKDDEKGKRRWLVVIENN